MGTYKKETILIGSIFYFCDTIEKKLSGHPHFNSKFENRYSGSGAFRSQGACPEVG